MPDSAKATTEAVAEASSLEEARAAAGAAKAKSGGPGTADPLLGELRRGGLLHLLVLHFCSSSPSYGNQLIERISKLTGGWLSVNPNTMYPLLRTLEGKELIAGEWEHPERRSRRYYRITERGRKELERLTGEIVPRLDAVAHGIDRIRSEVFGRVTEEP